jgi:hypothetical protein
MKIKKIGIPSIIRDNDMEYMSRLFRLLEQVDSESSITITNTRNGYTFTIRSNKYKEVRDEVKEMNLIFGIEAAYTSLNTSSILTFNIK